MKIVVLTCEKYTWLVPVFMHFLRKYWPDNPYEIEIVADAKKLEGKVFYTKGRSWSSGILNYINQSIDQSGSDTFLLMPEDYVIKSQVDTNRVKLAESLCKGKAGCVRLNAPDKYYKYTVDSGVKYFKEYPLDRLYSMSMQAAIWQKSYLQDVLRHKEDAWQAEIDGSKRLAGMKDKWRILWPKSAIIDYEAGGIMKKGRPQLPVMQWALTDLIK